MRWRYRWLTLIAAAIALPVWAHDGGDHPTAETSELYAPPEPGTYRLPGLGKAADGRVLTSDGVATNLVKVFDGRLVVLSFIYTNCGDADGCPLATAVLHRVQREIAKAGSLADRVKIVSLSFDPERDTPAAMARYAAPFNPARVPWVFLTTRNEQDLAPLLHAFGQHVQEEWAPEGQSLSTLSHLLRVFLIDGEQNIRNIYGATTLRAELLRADLETLWLEEDNEGSKPYAIATTGAEGRRDLSANAQTPPLGLPPLPVPSDNPMTREKVDLGRKLFFDRRLSHNDTVSCGICHLPEQGFTNNEIATSVGIEGRSVRRNAPSLFNVAYQQRLLADGRETRLETQIWKPLLAHEEMDNPAVGFLLEKLRSLDDYKARFDRVFPGRGLSMETLGMAIASYERGLVSADSPFDRWRFAAEETALTPTAERGFALFVGKAGCAACHRVEENSALFSDHAFHNTGVGIAALKGKAATTQRVEVAPERFLDVPSQIVREVSGPVANDLGRYEVTRDPDDRYRYRTPPLRNVALTAPYMHDGSLATLGDVVRFYNEGGIPNPLIDPLIRPLGLNEQEIDDLVHFLRMLTGSNVSSLIADARSQSIGER